jgi:hypothetical protein
MASATDCSRQFISRCIPHTATWRRHTFCVQCRSDCRTPGRSVVERHAVTDVNAWAQVLLSGSAYGNARPTGLLEPAIRQCHCDAESAGGCCVEPRESRSVPVGFGGQAPRWQQCQVECPDFRYQACSPYASRACEPEGVTSQIAALREWGIAA